MPADLEDRLTHGLGDLARVAPIPEHWPELGAPVIRLDGPPRRRPRLVTAVVAAAAVIIVVATVLAVQRTSQPGRTTRLHVASQPDSAHSLTDSAPTSDQNSASALATMGQWDPNGPRLTDAQLAKVVEIAEPPAGDAFVTVADAHVFARAAHSPIADEPRVTRLRVVKTTVAAIGSASLLPDPAVIGTEPYRHLELALAAFRHGNTPQVVTNGAAASPFATDTPIWLVEQHATSTCGGSGSSVCRPGASSSRTTAFSLMRVQPLAGTDIEHSQTISTGVDGDVDLDLGALGSVGTWTVN